MRIIILIILCFCFQQLFSQNTHEIYINGNCAIQNKSSRDINIFNPSYIRKYGTDIGFRYNISIQKNRNIEFGITSTIWGRDNYPMFNATKWYLDDSGYLTDTKLKLFTDKIDFLIVDFKIPVLLNYKLKKINFKIGPVFYANSFYVFTEDIYLFRLNRNYNIGYNLNIGYDINQKINIELEFAKQCNMQQKNIIGQKQVNRYSLHSILGLGIAYKINKKMLK